MNALLRVQQFSCISSNEPFYRNIVTIKSLVLSVLAFEVWQAGLYHIQSPANYSLVLRHPLGLTCKLSTWLSQQALCLTLWGHSLSIPAFPWSQVALVLSCISVGSVAGLECPLCIPLFHLCCSLSGLRLDFLMRG